MAGLTSQGLTIKTLNEILADLRTRARSPVDGYGPQVDVDPDSPLGQAFGVFAIELSQAWDLIGLVYSSMDPDEASGDALDNVSALVGVSRQNQQKTKGDVTATGTPGTLIPEGSIVRIPGGARFLTTEDTTLAGTGLAIIPVEAETFGPIEALAGTITEIVNGQAGWDSVTNDDDLDRGRFIETDAELRVRRERSLQIVGAGPDQAIRSRLEGLIDVDAAVVISNRTLATVNGIPAKAFHAVIWPDTVPAGPVIQAIYDTMPAGIQPFGAVCATVTDAQGYAQTVCFSYATELEIHLEAVIAFTSAYPADGDDQVKDLLVAHAFFLSIGDDYILIDAICGVKAGVTNPDSTSGLTTIPGVPGIKTFQLRAKVGLPPTPSDIVDITVDLTEIATVDIANIIVSSSPAP